MRRVKTAILISGHGSNLQAILDAAQAPDYPAEIALVISNVDTAYGLTRAQNAGITTVTIPHGNYPSREAFDRMVDASLNTHGIELVVMAGFMRILSDWFVEQWAGKLINIHPSLLPKYKGLNTHARAIAAGDSEHGATVHWVTPELDSGEIIAQSRTPIAANETPETLKEKVHALEHTLYPEAVKKVALGMGAWRPKHYLVKGFPNVAINRHLKLEIDHDAVRIHGPLWKKIAHKHPESLSVVEHYLHQAITSPNYVGQAAHHFANIELVLLRGTQDPLLVAIKIRDARGFYCFPLIASAYLIKPITVRNRIQSRTLHRLK
jgi:phosphoribosylglycinamide formyltransferase-1